MPKTITSTFTPLNDKVLVRRSESEQKSPGGIVLPEQAREKPVRGVVVAVGIGRLLQNGDRAAMQVAVDDDVIFSRYAGSDIKIDGEDFIVMDESDILGKI